MPLLGIDISNNQGAIHWPSVDVRTSHGELAFAFIKASEGTSYRDPDFASNWAGARARRLVVGAYHFPHFETSPQANAELLLEMLHGVGGGQHGQLPPALDVELRAGESPPPPGQLHRWIEEWVTHVHDAIGRPPIIYTGSLWKDVLGAATSAWRCPLWLADWGVARPALPAAWRRWTFWQFTDTGVVPGIRGNVDMEWFAGDRAALERLADQAPGPGPSPPGPRPPAPAPAGPPAWPGHVLKRGSRGSSVMTWQHRMRQRGFVRVRADGDFDAVSEEAARWLALYLQLPATGQVDEALWRASWTHV